MKPYITLESLTEELLTNQAYLSRHINSHYDQNFKFWINSLRIGEAQRLISDQNELTLPEISEMVGIQNSSTFYRNFVSVTGITPAEYRKEIASKNNN